MTRGRPGAWVAVALGGLYFIAPLIATFEFSLRMRRGEYSFDAYRAVFASVNFQASFLYSTLVALVTIVVAALIVVPAAYFVQLRLPRLRAIVEFITLLPLVIPAIVLVFGYIRLYGSSSVLPLTATSLGADALLTFGYVGLGLPYMYRSVDAGLRAIDVRTLTEAAESQGAGAVTILFHVVVPNILRHRDRRVHLREPARPAGVRAVFAADRRLARLRAGRACRNGLCPDLGLPRAHPARRWRSGARRQALGCFSR
jgi:putative spermidine/putrescine transport system permease protein